MHWLKTDFDKWKDEDESDDEDPSGSFVRKVIHVVELQKLHGSLGTHCCLKFRLCCVFS